MTDPFAGPAILPSTFPTVASFRGRLVLIKPLKQETVPNNLGAPGSTQERVTADITVVDGLGPVPQMKGNPPTPTGQMFDGPEYRGVYVQSEVIVKQLADALAARTSVLAWIDTRNPGTQPMKGNPWGLIDATQNPDAVNTARQFLATQMVGAASAPAAQNQAPVYAQQTPAGYPAAAATITPQAAQYVPAQPATYAAATPAQAAPVGPATNLATELAHEQLRQSVPQNVPYQAPPAAQPLPQPGSAPAGVNPFA
ncbi:MAG TPA: hypothetical protein VFX97_20670 [Pyrinomonadaceae bacterium]|nr:hypothetical protein [Pyrinomonadaceae bacterium]